MCSAAPWSSQLKPKFKYWQLFAVSSQQSISRIDKSLGLNRNWKKYFEGRILSMKLLHLLDHDSISKIAHSIKCGWRRPKNSNRLQSRKSMEICIQCISYSSWFTWSLHCAPFFLHLTKWNPDWKAPEDFFVQKDYYKGINKETTLVTFMCQSTELTWFEGEHWLFLCFDTVFFRTVQKQLGLNYHLKSNYFKKQSLFRSFLLT